MKIQCRLILFVCAALVSIPVWAGSRIEVHGHRGARGVRPENTLPAFQFALENEVDVLELDIAVTADNVLVISHDPFINTEHCLGPGGAKLAEEVPIHTLSLAKVKEFDCGSVKNPKFPRQVPVPGTRLATLEELFQMITTSPLPWAKKIQFNIETKIYPSKPELTPEPAPFAGAIIALVRKYGLVSRVMLQSFDDRTLRASKKIEPKLRTSLLTSDNHLDYVAVCRSIRADILSPDADWILPEDVRALHKAGVKLAPWTVNDPKVWERLVAMDVDAIISDVPDELIAFLKAKGRH